MAGPDTNGFIEINIVDPVLASQDLDATVVAFGADSRFRERMVIGGDQAAELADVLNADPSATTYGLVTRDVGLIGLKATLDIVERNSRPAEWAEIASAANATATATRAGEAGKSHYVTSIAGSFDIVPTTGIRLDLREAGVNKYSIFIGEHTDLELARPFKMAVGTTATLVLAAGGIGSTGLVTVQGYTA